MKTGNLRAAGRLMQGRLMTTSDVCGSVADIVRISDCARFMVGRLVIAAILQVLVWRLLDEGKFLAVNPAGYREYQDKVRIGCCRRYGNANMRVLLLHPR